MAVPFLLLEDRGVQYTLNFMAQPDPTEAPTVPTEEAPRGAYGACCNRIAH